MGLHTLENDPYGLQIAWKARWSMANVHCSGLRTKKQAVWRLQVQILVVTGAYAATGGSK